MLGALEQASSLCVGLLLSGMAELGAQNLERMKYHDYLKTDYWKAVAQAVKKRAGYRCQICNSQHDLQAHHRCYDHKGKELQHLDDLTCLCRRCHAIFHGQLPQVAPEPRQRKEKTPRAYGVVVEPWVEFNMPAGTSITLTHELIERCRTDAHAFTNATLRAWGVKPPLIRGWVARLEGKVVTAAEYRQALRGRFIYNSGKLS
jgi:hypothetical protein